ncbi:MAG: peptide deformylase [Actinomycetota bacterium]
MLLPIRTLGDPVLREPAKPVESFDRALRQLAKDMIETMYEAPGVGLAAPQVGMSLRLFVFDDGEHGPRFIANPELSEGEGETTEEEGCLSIPGPYHPTTRFRQIRCRGLDQHGEPQDLVGEGLLARILQHETDHLQGMLYIDRLDDDGRKAVLAELRRIELGLVEPRSRRRS